MGSRYSVGVTFITGIYIQTSQYGRLLLRLSYVFRAVSFIPLVSRNLNMFLIFLHLYQRTERMQDKQAAPCLNSFFPHVHFNISYALEHVKLHTLSKRMLRLDTMILNQVYLGSKICPLLETLGPPPPARYSRGFSMFIFCSSSKRLFFFFFI